MMKSEYKTFLKSISKIFDQFNINQSAQLQ